MPRITRDSLLSLEAYARQRNDFRSRVIAHKKNRSVQIGGNITLIFEDELTVRYQIQEMLRIERTFEESGIADELDAYSPLVPDGSNWKATMMIEYPDPHQRQRWLARLIGIEDRVWVQIAAQPKVFALADEDLDRENDVKTSSVHFLRFELSDPMMEGLRKGAEISVGVDHPEYAVWVSPLPANIRASLCEDLS